MRDAARTAVVLFVVTACRASVSAQAPVLTAVQVHGNTLTPEAEVVQSSGLTVGMPFSDSLLEEATARLIATKRFQRVDVLKRYASIVDETQILVLIRLDEGPVRVVEGTSPGDTPRVARQRAVNVMFAPLLDVEDGYGLSYGVQLAFTSRSGAGSRVMMPVSWGGNKRAGIEVQHYFAQRWAPRARGGVQVQRRTHPFFRSEADLVRTWGRGEWRVATPLFVGVTAAWQEVRLLGRTDRVRSIGADVAIDTRLDPVLPRNAIYVKAALDRQTFSDGPTLRTRVDASGFVGTYRGSVLVLRAVRDGSTQSVPPFFKAILGGTDSLRGFRAGSAVADTIMTASAELRVPLTSPLNVAKLGVCAFMDTGTAYDTGQRLSERGFRKGVGGGLWATAALFRVSLMLAHGIGGGNRVHLDAGLTF